MDKEKFDWPKKAVLDLIRLWESFECLYDKNNKFYHDRMARCTALNDIADTLNVFYPEITATDVKNKMQHLRRQYTRELAKIRNSEADVDEVYTPAAYWYHELWFLEDFIKTRKADFNSINENSLQIGDPLEETGFPVPPPTKRPCIKSEIFQSNHTIIQERSVPSEAMVVVNSTTTPRTEVKEGKVNEVVKAFCNFIQAELNEISNLDLRDELMENITLVVFEARKKRRATAE